MKRQFLLNWLVIAVSGMFIVWCLDLILSAHQLQDEVRVNVNQLSTYSQFSAVLQEERGLLSSLDPDSISPNLRDSLQNNHLRYQDLVAQTREEQVVKDSMIREISQYLTWRTVQSHHLGALNSIPGKPEILRAWAANNDALGMSIRNEVGRLRLSNRTISIDLKEKWNRVNTLAIVSCLLAMASSILFLINSKRSAEIRRSRAEALRVREMNEFMARVNHEIRTPLNAVIGLTELIEQEDIPPKLHGNLGTLKYSARHLLNVINDSLDFNKIESKRIELMNEGFDLRSMLQELQKSYALEADQKGIALYMVWDEKLPFIVESDRFRLTQILTNLVSNAIKFTRSGSVSISIRLMSRVGDRVGVRFEVTDTGIGIPQEELPRIFSSYQQANSTISPEFGGTGLGLPIARRLLLLFGSDLEVESEVDKGSVFRFDLHLKLVQSGKTGSTTDSVRSDLEEGKEITGKRVLVVEDNKVNQLVLKQVLMKWDMEISFALNGEIALGKVEEQDFDLVLMDLQMPVMDGYEATHRIRALKDPRKSKVPIIALTASDLEDTRKKAVEAGVSDFVTKPFLPNRLRAAICHVIDREPSGTSQTFSKGA